MKKLAEAIIMICLLPDDQFNKFIELWKVELMKNESIRKGK